VLLNSLGLPGAVRLLSFQFLAFFLRCQLIVRLGPFRGLFVCLFVCVFVCFRFRFLFILLFGTDAK
jgi:hypothetical protein